MTTKDCKFCDQCGKQLTVFDSDGDPVHNGIEVKGKIAITKTELTRNGSSFTGLFNMADSDLCSVECLTKRFTTRHIKVGAPE